jgi:hypothetical protein
VRAGVAVAGREVTVGMKFGISPGATAEVVGLGPGTAGAQAARKRMEEITEIFVKNGYCFIADL